jgi:hypothetical protein
MSVALCLRITQLGRRVMDRRPRRSTPSRTGRAPPAILGIATRYDTIVDAVE